MAYMGNHRKSVNYFQLDSGAGVPAWSPAVQLQEQVGEGEVDLEVETCLPLLSNHPGLLQGRLTKDKHLLLFCFFLRLPCCYIRVQQWLG